MARKGEVVDGGTRSPSMSRDLFWTTAASIGVLIGNVILAALLARRGTAEVFEPYNLAKRLSAAALPVVTLGLTVGVVKMVASARDEDSRREFARTAIVLVAAALVIGSAICAIFPEAIARAILGTDDVALLWAVWAYTAALVVNAVVFSLYRAELRQQRANVVNFTGVVVIPLFVVAVLPSAASVENLLAVAAGAILVWNGTQLIQRLAGASRQPWFRWRTAAARMLRYSLPRVPAGLATGSLVAMPSVFARHAGDVTSSAYVLAGIYSAQMASASLQAFGIVLLPRVSAMRSGGRIDEIARIVETLTFGTLLVSAATLPVAVVAMPSLLPMWLGPGFVGAALTVQIATLALPGVMLFNVLRSVADGVLDAPVNTYAAVSAVTVAAAGMATAGGDSVLLAGWFSLGQVVTGGAVAIALARSFPLQVDWLYLAYSVTSGLVLAGLVWTLNFLVEGVTGDAVSLIVGAIGWIGLMSRLITRAPTRYGFQGALARLRAVVTR